MLPGRRKLPLLLPTLLRALPVLQGAPSGSVMVSMLLSSGWQVCMHAFITASRTCFLLIGKDTGRRCTLQPAHGCRKSSGSGARAGHAAGSCIAAPASAPTRPPRAAPHDIHTTVLKL